MLGGVEFVRVGVGGRTIVTVSCCGHYWFRDQRAMATLKHLRGICLRGKVEDADLGDKLKAREERKS